MDEKRGPICFVFSRYSRLPRDGKQNQFFKFVPLLAEVFPQVAVLGLARGNDDLQGTVPRWPANVTVEELVLPGSYDFQAVFGLGLGVCPLPVPGWRDLRRWVRQRDTAGTVFFFEGFPLAGVLRWVQHGRVCWGEVDSYLRRAHRMKRAGVRRGVKAWLGVRASALVESVGLKRASASHVYSQEDERFMRRVHRHAKLSSIPIIFDRRAGTTEGAASKSRRSRVLIWADASYPYLEAGVRAVLAATGPKVPGIAWDYVFLIGRNAALQAEIATKGWEVHARIDDLDQFLGEASVVVIPDLTGTGLKNRTLYALACGVPVLGTRAAWEGIPRTYGREGWLLPDVSELPQQLAIVLPAAGLMRASGAGPDLVCRHFSSAVIGPQWRRFLSGNSYPAK